MPHNLSTVPPSSYRVVFAVVVLVVVSWDVGLLNLFAYQSVYSIVINIPRTNVFSLIVFLNQLLLQFLIINYLIATASCTSVW
jgi:hypothetical protein